MGMKNFFIVFLLILGISDGIAQDKKSVQEKMKVLDQYLKYAVVNNGFSGQLLVANDDYIWIDQGYGYADRAKKIEISSKTIFDIGEVADQFTVTALLKLEEEGKLSLVDNISKFFNYVPEDKANITIHQLITHTSGLPLELGGDYEIVTRSKMVSNAMSTPLLFAPGQKFSYSKAGYNLLAAIIEIVSEDSYEVYLDEKMFEEADMSQTGYTIPKFSDKNIAVGYAGEYKWGKPSDHVLGDGPSWYAKGHSGFLSNTGDLYSWYAAVHGEHILGPDNVYRLFLPQVEMNDEKSSVYCYGWVASQSNHGGNVLISEGNNKIFDTKFNMYLESGIVIILITNAYNDSINEIFDKIEQHVFN